MMISPQAYYEIYLKGKSVNEIEADIRKLKRTISDNIRILQKNQVTDTPVMFCEPSPDVIISVSREYLEMARKALEESGKEYKLSRSEVKDNWINNNLDKLEYIHLEYGGLLYDNFCKVNVTLTENDAVIVNSVPGKDSLRTPAERKIEKSYFIEELKNLHMGEWKRYYNPYVYNVIVADGFNWKLELKLNRKQLIFEGDNLVPYNFEQLKELLGLTIFDEFSGMTREEVLKYFRKDV